MSIKADQCSQLLKVLADETRLAIVEQLLEGSKNVGEMNSSINMEQSLLSHHLRVLRDAELVTSVRVGKSVVYSLTENFRDSSEKIDLGCCKLSFR